MRRTLIVFLQLFVFVAPIFAAELDLNKVLADVQTKYDKIKEFSGEFTQVFHHKVLKRQDSSEGKVVFRKPGLMRWHYTKPSEKIYIVDGKALWVYQPKDKSAMVDRCFKQDTLSASLSFLWGGGNISKEFDATKFTGQFGDKTDVHIQLTPKEKSKYYKRLILVIDSKTNQVKQSIVVDLEGNTNQFIFKGIQFDGPTSDKDFAFDPPKDVHVSNIPGSAEKCKS